MIKLKEKLTILHDDNSVFNDLSNNLASFDRDTESLTFVSAEDSIYVGFYKPINCFYVHLGTANTNDVELSVQYYNGSAFTSVSGLHDDSKGFQRSGFVKWDRNLKDLNDNLDEAKTTVNSSEKYWYKLDLSGDSSAMVINGLNLVFCDDQDLKREVFEILDTNFLPSGETSHILTLEACKNQIIQDLNLLGKDKKDAVTGYTEGISAFDILDASEVNLASVNLALSKIFSNVQDQVDDLYMQKSEMYKGKYNKIINAMEIKVDADDDGKYDKEERDNIIRGRIIRE